MNPPLHSVPDDAEPGWVILDQARNFLERFVAFPSPAALDSCVLWACHTHLFEALSVSPRIAFLSELPGSGKTLAMELVGSLSHDASLEVELTGAALTALVSQRRGTVLLDEVDNYWGASGGSASHAALRSIVNSGYRAGAFVTRMRSGTYVRTPVFAPIAMAGLGQLPRPTLSRCVVIKMAQRTDEQEVESYYPRQHAKTGLQVREALGKWASSVAARVGELFPDMPDGVTNRDAEIWEPLLSIASEAGGEWPERARAACVELVLNQSSEPAVSPAKRLLMALREVWQDSGNLPSSEVVARLLRLKPYSSMWTTATAPREISALLSTYGISPVKVRDGNRTCQGYRRSDVFGVVGVSEETDDIAV